MIMIKVGIGSGNGLVPPGDKPLAEPMLKQLQHKMHIWHQDLIVSPTPRRRIKQ